MHVGINYADINKCSESLKNNKLGGNDVLVGELIKYGGKGMAKDLYEEVCWHFSMPTNPSVVCTMQPAIIQAIILL